MKAKRLILTSLCFVGIFLSSFAQSTYSSSINIGLGAAHHRFIDEAFTASRLKFAGTPFKLGLSYEKKSDAHLIQAMFQGSFGAARAGEGRLQADLAELNLGVSYGRSVFKYRLLNAETQAYAGAQINSFNYAMQNQPVLENVSLAFRHTINMLLFQTSRFDERNRLEIELGLPVAGWVKRSIYDGGANQELENDRSSPLKLFFGNAGFSLLNPLASPRIQIAYLRRIAPKTDFSVRYRFHYLYDNAIEPLNLYSNGLLLGLSFNF